MNSFHEGEEGWEQGWAILEARITNEHIRECVPWEEHVELIRRKFEKYCWEWNKENLR